MRLINSGLRRGRILAVAPALLVPLLFVFCAQAADKSGGNQTKVSGWRIEQNSNYGHLTLLLCPKGARMSWRNKEFVSVCKAPDFIPVLFNPKRKNQYIGKPEKWNLQSPHLPKEIMNYETPSREAAKWRGMPASKVTFKVSNSDSLKERLEFAYQESSNRSRSFNKIEVVYSEWIKIAPQLLRYLAPYYKYPDMQQFPLECMHRYPDGSSDIVLSTIKVEPAMISNEEFSVPSGLAVSRLRDEVIDGRDQRQNIPGVVEDLFGGKN